MGLDVEAGPPGRRDGMKNPSMRAAVGREINELNDGQEFGIN